MVTNLSLLESLISNSTRKARITKANRNTNHAELPKIPVEAIWVGINPTPKGNVTPQKGVALTSVGLYMSQLFEKVLGPEPKRLFCESTALEILRVVERVGRTSALFTLKALEVLVANELGLMMKIRETTPKTMGSNTG